MIANTQTYHEESSASARLRIILRVEWMMLSLRYLLYAALALLSLTVNDETLRRMFIVAGTSALVHNLFSHWIFYTRRHLLFTSAWNFLLYLFRFCLLVGITGGPASPLAPVFLLLLIGYHVYRPKSFNTLWITLLVAAAYSFVLLANWFSGNRGVLPLPVYANLFFIAACGWIMHILARTMSGLERAAELKTSALKSSEAMLRAILNHTAHPIIVYDETEIITDVNDVACDFFGLPRENILGLRLHSLIFDDGTLADIFEDLKRTGSLHHEMLVLPAGGSERNVFMHIHSFLSDGRRLFVALFHDVASQKELQEAHHLASLNLEKANQELQRVVDLRADFYITIANRLRSPLAAILGFINMLLDEQLGKITKEQNKALHSCRRSLARIFDQLDEAFILEGNLRGEEMHADTPEEETSEADAQRSHGNASP